MVFVLAAVLIAPSIMPLKASATIVSNTKSKTMYTGNTATLKIGGSVVKANFTSSDTDVACVTQIGKVTALASGSTVISCKYDGQKYKWKLTILDNEYTSLSFVTVADYDNGISAEFDNTNITIPANSYTTETFEFDSDCIEEHNIILPKLTDITYTFDCSVNTSDDSDEEDTDNEYSDDEDTYDEDEDYDLENEEDMYNEDESYDEEDNFNSNNNFNNNNRNPFISVRNH